MHKIKLTLIVCVNLIILSCSSENISNQRIRIMTFNIRVNVESDSLNAWPYRKEIAASMIRFHRADIVGIQEALRDQVKDLAEHLPQYLWFGVGRDDGREAGEFMAIYLSQGCPVKGQIKRQKEDIILKRKHLKWTVITAVIMAIIATTAIITLINSC